MKTSRILYFAAIGFLGGLGSWVLIQIAFHGVTVLSNSGVMTSQILWLNTIIPFEGALLGLCMGMILNARMSLWYHHEWMSIASKMLKGALLGFITGLISFAIGQSLLGLSPIAGRLVSWILLGLSLGGTTALLQSRKEIFWPRFSGGILGGVVAGVIFELLMLYQMTGPDHLAGLLIFGVTTSLVIGLLENRAASHALRVLSGKMEGQVFMLDQNRFTLGYGSQNDLVLNGYSEVCDFHALVQKKDRQILIENTENGGELMVNYRLVDQQAMKKGDVIKLGTALLQYYEI